jgi:hypothetical protein
MSSIPNLGSASQEMTGSVDQKPPSRVKNQGKGRHARAAQMMQVNACYSTDPHAPTLAQLQRGVAPLLVQLFKAMAACQGEAH